MYKLEELKQQWEVDCQIDPFDLGTSAIRTANLHQKYLNILTDYKLRMFKFEKDFLEMKGLRVRYYMGQLTKQELETYGWTQYQYKTPLKSELERLLQSDTILLNMLDKQRFTQMCIDYTDEIMKSLKERTWQIRNAIEWRKFESGA